MEHATDGPVRDCWNTVVTYMRNLCFGFEYKAAIATVMTVFTDVLGGHAVVLYGFFALATIDMLLGVLRAVVFQNFETRLLGKWMVKLSVQMFLASVILLFFHMLSVTAGVTIAIANWLFLLFAFNDLCSIVSKVESLGFRIPTPITVLLHLLRRRTAFDIAQYLRVPEMREHIEHEIAKSQAAERKGGDACGNHS